MKNTLLFLTLLLLISCSVQKRKYQKGFYVNRFHHLAPEQKTPAHHSALAAKEQKKQKEQNLTLSTGDHPQMAGSGNDLSALHLKPTKPQLQMPPDTCDILVFRDGSEIRAKVLEVAPGDIKYKRCDNIEGPSYVTRKSDLFMLKYANGTKEVMKEEPVAPKEFPAYNANAYRQTKYDRRKAENHPLAILSLVLSIMGMVIILFGLALAVNSVSPIVIAASVICSMLAVVLGISSIQQIRASDGRFKGKGQAIPGIIMGAVMLTIWLFVLLIFLSL